MNLKRVTDDGEPVHSNAFLNLKFENIAFFWSLTFLSFISLLKSFAFSNSKGVTNYCCPIDGMSSGSTGLPPKQKRSSSLFIVLS